MGKKYTLINADNLVLFTTTHGAKKWYLRFT